MTQYSGMLDFAILGVFLLISFVMGFWVHWRSEQHNGRMKRYIRSLRV